MGWGQLVSQYTGLQRSMETLKRILYRRCRELNARLAIVGSRNSARLLLEALNGTDLPLAGVYERDGYRDIPQCAGHPVQPLRNLSALGQEDVVILASNAPATDLWDAMREIRALCPARILDLKNLADNYILLQGLKDTLGFEYEEYLFDYWLRAREGETTPWCFLPPDLSLTGKTVLELGPFEAHNAFALMQQKPSQVIALEARPINFAKVAVIKAMMDWPNYHLRLGDMHLWPQLVTEPVDVIFSSGVFYHSSKPWWLLETCMTHCDTMILCGHVSSPHSPQPRDFREVTLESGTYRFEVYPEYGDPLSGMNDHSLWFREEDLERFLRSLGCRYQKFNQWVNPHGLWICALVTREG